VLRTDRVKTRDVNIPAGLPDHLRSPVVRLDPDLDQQNRRFQAFKEFTLYSRDLSTWLSANGHGHQRASDVQEALGTPFDAFLRAADEAGGQEYGPDGEPL